MILLAALLILIGVVLWCAPHTLQPPSRTVGAILTILGVILLILRLLDHGTGAY